MRPAIRLGATALALALAGGAATAAAQEVNVYSARHYDTDNALYERFTEETGIEVNVIEGGSDELIERINAEGVNSPADVLITVDAGRLWRAVEADVFQSATSDMLEERVPEHLRHPDGLWYGLTKRARVIYYNKEAGPPAGVSTYEDLTDFDGTICIRSSSNIYNQSLLASMIAAHGAEAAEEWAAGVVDHFARPPAGNDRAQIRGVAAGECTVAVANTYYLGHMLSEGADPADAEAAVLVDFMFPNQDGRGAHVNISGAGVVANAPNKDNAIRFLEFLTSDGAQEVFAGGNNEYPVVEGVEVTGPIADYGTDFVEDTVNASLLGENNPEAVRIFDRVGWP
ncbi:MAG: Fe(3+) ABC transporter substrate-binding protein [Azospirillaceae bacterium]